MMKMIILEPDAAMPSSYSRICQQGSKRRDQNSRRAAMTWAHEQLPPEVFKYRDDDMMKPPFLRGAGEMRDSMRRCSPYGI